LETSGYRRGFDLRSPPVDSAFIHEHVYDARMNTREGEPQPKRIETISRGLVLQSGRVLLCRDRKGGYCYLPGGHVDPGESAADALVRELSEEAGLTRVRIGTCALVTEQRFLQGGKPRHEINLVFHVEQAYTRSGEAIGGLESESDSPGGSAPPLPRVESLEDHIEFIWAEAAALNEIDIRPLSLKAWLMTGNDGLDRPGWMSQSEW
jgi:8-oxo-dGTP diphosphatase